MKTANPLTDKTKIVECLKAFESGSLASSAIHFFDTLGYRSSKTLQLEPNTTAGLLELSNRTDFLNPTKAHADELQSVDFLFQLTDEEIRSLAQAGLDFDSKADVQSNKLIESYIFFSVELRGDSYPRTVLADITREINRLFPMPALVLFKHGKALTLSIINRRIHKRDAARDVLEKVTLIKDIRIEEPHRGQVEILFDLAFAQLTAKHEITNFIQLEEAWRNTLDTSELNKRFYKDLANWYFWALQHVEFPKQEGVADDVNRATNVIRLITRLIFVWFLKERELVPDALFDRNELSQVVRDLSDDKSTFYKAILQNLFFATLNTPMTDKKAPRAFRQETDGKRFNDQYMVHNQYRHEKLFTDSKQALEMFAGIPFLNGGLFECLDKREEVNGKLVEMRIDGFSDISKKQPTVPNKLFFSSEEQIDLNDVYGTRNKRYTVRGLIDTLDRYKFTIAENTPIEEEVALDPELLGKVFENLLASYNPETGATARKQTGSFYTPREIVNYMVDESLIVYLETQLAAENDEEQDGLNRRLRQIFAYTDEPHQFSDEEADELIAAIDRVKILDPACGSGAFPMGILQKLVSILSKLDPKNAKWEQRQIERVREAMRAAEKIEDHKFRENTLRDLQIQITSIEDAFARNELDYGRKLFLIENCIYGVDIQPIAIQIAKLRFFISLIIDQRINTNAENLGIRPLPNLETKFVAASAILSIEKPDQGMLQNEALRDAILEKEHQLRIVRERHFMARTTKTKEKYRKEDEGLRHEMGKLLEKDNWPPTTTAKLLAWNPYDQNSSAGFFDTEWMFGIGSGFDIVIGNPPYIRIQNLDEDVARVLKARFRSATGKFDVYVLFVEQSFSFINSAGVICFIHPHRFLTADYGNGLKRFLDSVKGLRSAVCFGVEQIFEAGTTYTGVFSYSFDNSHLNFKTANSQDFDKTPFITKQYSSEGAHWISPTQESSSSDLVAKLSSYDNKLTDVFEGVFQGLVTVGDSIFVLEGHRSGGLYQFYSDVLSGAFEIEAGILKPLLKGENIRRFIQPTSDLMIFYPHYQDKDGRTRPYEEAALRKEYPLAYDYIHRFKKPLFEKKIKYKTNPKYWFSLHRAREIRMFSQTKIVTPQLQNYPNFTIDNESWFPDAGGYSLIKKVGVKTDYRFYLALLNSSVLWYFIKHTSNPYSSNYYYFKSKYLEPFSFPNSTKNQEASFVKLVDQVLAAKSKDSDAKTDQLEHEIDQLVYDLYALTADERAIVEASVKR